MEKEKVESGVVVGCLFCGLAFELPQEDPCVPEHFQRDSSIRCEGSNLCGHLIRHLEEKPQ